jgi:hypothetical protein
MELVVARMGYSRGLLWRAYTLVFVVCSATGKPLMVRLCDRREMCSRDGGSIVQLGRSRLRPVPFLLFQV